MKKRGRPKGGAQISREEILSAAFSLLNEAGHQGLSMRALASRLAVTPMALYGHFRDRDALVRAMSDAIYLRVVRDFESTGGSPRRRLQNLMGLYYDAVVYFPQLTILIFASPTEFSNEVQSINQHLASLLVKSNLKSVERKMWLEIIIDLTHGNALAVSSSPPQHKSFMKAQKIRYQKQLGALLSYIF